MQVITVRNVHEALPTALDLLSRLGEGRNSRNGPVRVFPFPVTTEYREPRERVIFWRDRDANPFFHLMESLWMLAGRNDVAFVAQYVKRMRSFSDNGKTFHAAYGHRWRRHFGQDQLAEIVARLQDNPDDRRCVLQMWDCEVDLGKDGRDFPCNTQVYFSRNSSGALDMTVCCRSNDLIWGAYGANAVHFSVLQEFMAAAIGCPVGSYWQMSNNLHAYEDQLKKVAHLADEAADPFRLSSRNPYASGQVSWFPLVQTPIVEWQQDLLMFMDHGPIVGLRDPFFRRVVTPIYYAHKALQDKADPDRHDKALEILQQCKATDWQAACIGWVERRRDEAIAKEYHDAAE